MSSPVFAKSMKEALEAPLAVYSLRVKLTTATLPDELFELRNLAQLEITGGALTTLSPRLAELTKLKLLSLDKHPKLALDAFPVMPALESLGLRACELRALPASVFQCRKLRILGLGKNPLGEVPAGIGKLKALSTLYLWDCGLQEVSPELGALGRLTSLELGRNQLRALPDELAALKHLGKLSLEKNAFTAFPEVVCTLANLDSLVLHDNAITALPDRLAKLTKLTTLRLENNRVARFPADLSPMKALQTFYVSLGIPVAELQQQVEKLPPKAFVMSFEDGDLARDGRWASAPARSSKALAAAKERAAAKAHAAANAARQAKRTKPTGPTAPTAPTEPADAPTQPTARVAQDAGDIPEEQLFHFDDRVTSVAFVPGGVIGASYATAVAFDLSTGSERFRHEGQHNGLASKPDGTLLIGASNDVAQRDPATGEVRKKLAFATGYFKNWSSDGAKLLLYSADALHVIDARTYQQLHELPVGRTSFATLSPNGDQILHGCDKVMQLWDIPRNKEVVRWQVARFGVASARFISSTEAIFLCTEGLSRIDLAAKKPAPGRLWTGSAEAFALLPGNTRAVVGGPTIQVIDLATGQATATLGAHEDVGPIDDIVVSPDGLRIASCGCDKTVRVWRAPA